MAGSCSYVVGGNLSLEAGAKAAVHPVTVPHPFEEILRNEYTPVEIGGALSIADGAILYVHCEDIMGSHVRFAMKSAVIDGTIDANARGWNHFRAEKFIPGIGPIFENSYGSNGSIYYTFSYGPGASFSGASHGGSGGASSGLRAKAYGNPYAPCLPGSPSGVVSAPDAGGGVIRMHAKEAFALNGTLAAKGINHSVYNASAGGSIWITAQHFDRGPDSVLDARGGSIDGGGKGAGGRIAIGEGLQDEDIAALATETLPDHVTATDYSGNALVTGGKGGRDSVTGDPLYAPSGTAFYLTRDDVFVSVSVSTDITGVPTLKPTPGWGVNTFPVGEPLTLTTPPIGTDPAFDDRERYLCTGYTISNATQDVLSGKESEFQLPTDIEGPFWVIWHYGTKEYKTNFEPTEGGTLTGDGVVDGKGLYWKVLGTNLPAVEAVADKGHEFLFWTGDVPYGKARENPLQLTVDRQRDLKAVFRAIEDPVVRTWKKNATGEWLDPANWGPTENLPGFADTVVVDSGVCWAPNHVECGNLTVKGNGILRLCSDDPDSWRNNGPVNNWKDISRAPDGLEEVSLLVADDLLISEKGQLGIGYVHQPWQGRIVIGNDLRLSETGVLAATAGPVDGADFTHAKGCGQFTVGGTLEIGPGATFHPNSDPYTGGSFAIHANRLLVHEGGAIDAMRRGYGDNGDSTFRKSIAPGRGRSNNIGGGYGSKGVKAQGIYGQTYGQTNAPTQPGSPNGGYPDYYPGGGLIRVHADQIELDGSLLAAGTLDNWLSSGPSGGGIWLTARWFHFGPHAVLNAVGSHSVRNGQNDLKPQGGGGRIAIEKGLSPEAIDHLAATDELPAGKQKHVVDAAGFAKLYPYVTVDLRRGDYAEGCDGTFVYLDAVPQGTMLMLR